MKKLLMLVAVTMAAMMAFSAAPTKGLVSYYPFDGDAKDKSGNHNDGIMHGTRPTADRKGRLNSAMLFGEGNFITVPSSPSLNSPKDQITITAWIRVNEWYNNKWGQSAYILSKAVDDVKDVAYCFIFFATRHEVNNGGIAAGNISSVSCSHLYGGWHHVAMVSDGKIVKVYIDGIIVGASTVANRLDRHGRGGEMFIGRNPPIWGTEWLVGAMDELRIYNRALSDDEIKAVYEADPPTKTTKMETKGWNVTMLDCKVGSLGEAEAALQSNTGTAQDYSVLAFTNDGRVPFPEQHSAYRNNVAMRATGTITIPSVGMWTFGISCDDGAKIRIKGKDFADVITCPCTGLGTQVFPMNFPAAGDYELEVILYDIGRGGSFIVFSAAKGNWATFDKSVFRLVGDPECEIKMVAPKSAAKGSTCPDCKGEKVKLVKCKKCNGKGTITKSRKLSGGGTIKEGVKCPACSSASTPEKGKGSGRVKKVCPTCDGEGMVER